MPPDSRKSANEQENDGRVGAVVDPVWQNQIACIPWCKAKQQLMSSNWKIKNYLERHVGLLLAMLYKALATDWLLSIKKATRFYINEAAAAMTGMRIADMTVKQSSSLGMVTRQYRSPVAFGRITHIQAPRNSCAGNIVL